METGKYDLLQRELRRVNQTKSHALVQPTLQIATKRNMKEVAFINKEEIVKDRLPVRCATIGPGKVKRVPVCKRKGRPSAAASALLRRQTPDAGRTCDSDMANKENELACAEDVQGIHYANSYGFPVNSAETSKMAGAGSKYGDYFTELSKDHEAMTHVLFGRNLRLNVALTLWRRNASELVAYLIRIQDVGVLLDCLPALTKSLQDEAPCISLGCCVDLLPQVNTVLTSEYEEHLIVGLHWVQAVIKKWWPDLSANGKDLHGRCSENRNLEVMKQRLKDLWKEGIQLCSVPGTTGEIAKAIESYLSQLR